MIPGLNLLNVAAGAIAMQSVQLRRWAGEQVVHGEYVDVFSGPEGIVGSWQPVDLRRVAQLGLDLKREYRQLWTSSKIQGVQDQPRRGADQIIADGQVWEPISSTNDWNTTDGWNAIVFVRVAPYVEPEPDPEP